MSTSHPTTRTTDQGLSQTWSSLSETAPRRLHRCEQCGNKIASCTCTKVASPEEELRKAELESGSLRSEHAKRRNVSGRRKTVQERVSDLEKEHNPLKCELQSSKRDLGHGQPQPWSIRGDKASICQENDRLSEENKPICQGRESIPQEKERISQQNVSLGDELNSLEQEADTLRKENAHLKREKVLMEQEYSGRLRTLTEQRITLQNENALMKQEFSERLQTLTEQQTTLQNENALMKREFSERLQTLAVERIVLQNNIEELQRDDKQTKLHLQRAQQNAKEEIKQLQQTLDRETEKLKQIQQRELKDSSHPCPKPKCQKTRAERDQLAGKLQQKKCDKSECVSAKTEVEGMKKKMMQMEKKSCNSKTCQNQHLKDMQETIGSSKIRIGAGDHELEYSHSEALQYLVQRAEMQQTAPSEEVRSLQSDLQKMQLEKRHLEKKLDTATGSNAAGLCTRSDCQRILEELKRMQSENSQGRSAAEAMTRISGGEYTEPLEEFNEVFTNPDELLGVLESCLEPFEARTVLCEIFQFAYRLCKEAASQKISQTIEQLFTVSEDRSRKDVLAEISRVYGQLLHVSGLKNDEKICRDVCSKIVAQLTKDGVCEAFNKAGRALEIQAKQQYLLKSVQVAWKFVTLPRPIIACQPEAYIPQIVDREYGYWDDSTPDAPLIYTRPVVYRCYDGNRAEKGIVANRTVLIVQEGQRKGYLQQFTDFVLQRDQ